MDFVLLPIVAFLVSALTLFSGFGLGTILMPAFALFFPLPQAVALTAVVHFLNNIFKLFLLGKFANWRVVLKFGIPGILAAFLGAFLLNHLGELPPIYQYQWGERNFQITVIKILIAILMIGFAFFEMHPRLKTLSVDQKYLPLGGVISGFFGGLSGHQGVLRSVFLLHSDLTKEAFIATGVVIACLIDVARLFVYAQEWPALGLDDGKKILLGITILLAGLGTYWSSQKIKKVTIGFIQNWVAILLIVIALLLAAGLI